MVNGGGSRGVGALREQLGKGDSHKQATLRHLSPRGTWITIHCVAKYPNYLLMKRNVTTLPFSFPFALLLLPNFFFITIIVITIVVLRQAGLGISLAVLLSWDDAWYPSDSPPPWAICENNIPNKEGEDGEAEEEEEEAPSSWEGVATS